MQMNIKNIDETGEHNICVKNKAAMNINKYVITFLVTVSFGVLPVILRSSV